MKTARWLAAASILCAALCANAGWNVVNLHPAGATASWANSAADGKQCGTARFGDSLIGGIWSGSPASFSSLTPVTIFSSAAWGMDSSQLGGTYNRGTVNNRAALWVGPSQTFVNLHPSGADFSAVWGVGGGRQVGRVGNHAALWNGTASSYVDLAPSSQFSEAFSTNGINQVGQIWTGGEQATLWTGTAASAVNLHPTGATQSIAYDLAGNVQGGFARFGGVQHAGLWFATASSFLSLHPAGALASQVTAMSGQAQAGHVVFTVRPDDSHIQHAALWYGTPESMIDLHLLLPPGFESSVAQDVEVDARGEVWIVGWAFRPGNSNSEAVLWHFNPRGPRR